MELFLIAVLIVTIFLDRKKILQYNSIPIFLIFLYCSPFLIGASTMLCLLTLGIAAAPGASWEPGALLIPLLMSAGFVVFDLYILVRICKYPVNEKKLKNRSYDAACLKRLTFYRRAAFIPSVILMLSIIIFAVKSSIMITSLLVRALANPVVWLLCLVTGGAIIAAVIMGAVVMALTASYIAVITGTMAIWLYVMFLVFSYVQLFRIYRLGKLKLIYTILIAVLLFIFPVNFFVSPILTKTAKRTAQNCECFNSNT